MGFSSLPLESSVPAKNTEQPIYIPALLMMRDDEMINSNVGVFYDAPGVKHEDYFAFLLMLNILMMSTSNTTPCTHLSVTCQTLLELMLITWLTPTVVFSETTSSEMKFSPDK